MERRYTLGCHLQHRTVHALPHLYSAIARTLVMAMGLLHRWCMELYWPCRHSALLQTTAEAQRGWYVSNANHSSNRFRGCIFIHRRSHLIFGWITGKKAPQTNTANTHWVALRPEAINIRGPQARYWAHSLLVS